MSYWKVGNKVKPTVAGFREDHRGEICEVTGAAWGGATIKIGDYEGPYADYQLEDAVTGYVPPKPPELQLFNVVVRRRVMEVYATTPEEAKKEGIHRYKEGIVESFNPDHDVIVELKKPNASRGADRALTSGEMLNEMQLFVGQYGWKRLFELIKHDFDFHAHDRGEHENWKARPKNYQQLEMINKLCEFSDGEFQSGR